MIAITFNQSTEFDTSEITGVWLDRISVQKVSSIYKVTINIDVDDTSYRYRALMQRPQLVLKFSLPYFVEFPVGTSCVFQNQTFSLNDPENLKKQGNRDIEYTMTMGTKEDNLALYKLRNSVDGRLKWSMCARPHEFIEEICKSLNSRDGNGVWFCNQSHIIEATEKTIEFNHVYCDAALSSVAETFNSEYEIVDNGSGRFEITLHKVEYFKDSPLPLSYGKGNGFVPGLGRATEADGKPIKRLYVQGGSRNIDRSTYGAMFGYSNNPAELRLPKGQIIDYEGRKYISDSEGYYIERYDKASSATKEDSLDCSEIYPSYIGTVTKVEVPNAEKNFYDIIDSNIPSALDFNNYLIEGETMTIIFQSGMLAGREFDVKYKHDERRWELVPMEEDGITMPNATFAPSSANGGNTYAVFGIMLPKEYICDNASQTGAAWDMFKEAARHLYDNEEQKFTFSGELQGLFAKKNWLKIGGYLKVGSYIHFTDNQFAVDGVNIRIIGIKDFVNSPYSPTLEISNAIQSPTTVSSQLRQIQDTDVKIDDTQRSIIQFTKRRFRDAKETISMLEEALLDNFTNSINPITVQTMSALVGDESLQFEFGTYNGSTWIQRAGLFTYNNATKVLTCEMTYGGARVYLRHLTLGQNDITSASGRNSATYYTWPMNTYASPTLTEAGKRYYLYARVSRTNTNTAGTFLLSETAIRMEQETGYYHFLVGFLNSEYDGERSFVTLYGFTEILPGRITTDRIVSGNGESYLDLVANAFKLGERLKFNLDGLGRLILNGTLVQSQSGDMDYIGSYRGVYNSSYTYYQGDEVVYTDNAITSLYRHINPNPCRGIPPTNTTYWQVQARGSQGTPGNFVSTVFKRSNTMPSTPTGGTYDNPVPSGWRDGIPSGSAILWASTCTFYGAGGSSGWSTPAQETDTATLDIEFSPYTAQPSAPSGSTPFSNHESEGWYDPSSSRFNSVGTMIWRAERKVANGVYEGGWTITRIYGEKGDKGNTGNFVELRFAKNGSTTTPPTLSKTSLNPSGWSTTTPSVSRGEYLWMTKAEKDYTGSTLVSQWTDPVRMTPYDGTDGKNGSSPVLVFRGNYLSTNTYYGNANRLDCVKSGTEYYIARIDAGEFKNVAPPNTSYWNPFGANFESIATNLLLAEGANIGDWFISAGMIVSTLLSGNKITLNAKTPEIKIESDYSSGDYSTDTSLGANISISGSAGYVRVAAKNTSAVAYLSPTGILANHAGTQAVAATTVLNRKGAIVGLGYGSMAKPTWSLGADDQMLAGVYGYSYNSTYNGAPAYGGYFYDLKALGLILNVQYISDSTTNGTSIGKDKSTVIGLVNSGTTKSVYLPTDGYEGRTIFFHQMSGGTLRIYPGIGQKMYDDGSVNSYIDCTIGETIIACFSKYVINGTATEVWIIRSIRT